MIYSATNPPTDIESYTADLRRHLDENRPVTLDSPMGEHGVTYGSDDLGEYASIGATLPEGVYAEIEDGTTGQLQAYRIYLKESA